MALEPTEIIQFEFFFFCFISYFYEVYWNNKVSRIQKQKVKTKNQGISPANAKAKYLDISRMFHFSVFSKQIQAMESFHWDEL